MANISRNPIRLLYDAARNIKSNSTCALLEPLFHIPQSMYIGFLTLYKLELGVTLTQVGLITSLGLIIQLFFALISPFVVDKYGRRYTQLIFDFTCMAAVGVLWAVAQNIYFFIIAVILQGTMRIAVISWQCLMLEDNEPDIRIHIFNFLQLSTIIGGFFAPVGAIIVNRYTLVPGMRIILVFFVFCKILHNVLRHFLISETSVGRQKMEEMKGVSILGSLKIYVPVLKRFIKNKLLVIAIAIRALNYAQLLIRQTFLAVLVTNRLGFPAESMAVFYTINSIVMLVMLLFIAPLLAQITRRWPMILGIVFHILATAILLTSPSTQNYPLLIASAVLIAFGTSITTPRIEAMTANIIPNEDRSMANAIMGCISLLISIPIGYIGGVFSSLDARLPFLMTLSIFLISLILLYLAKRMETRQQLTEKGV